MTISVNNPGSSSSSGRELLTADRTYYVRTDGNDSNDGLANTSGGAFLTIQKGINTACSIDVGIYNVVVQVGAGTYTAALTLKPWTGGGTMTLRGDTSTPANVVISVTSDTCVTASMAREWTVEGFKLATTTSGNGLRIRTGTKLNFQSLDFGAIVGDQIVATYGGVVAAVGNYSITGNAARHINATDNGLFTRDVAITVTITGTPAFSSEFAGCSRNGTITISAFTFSGSATGKRYNSIENGCISTGGGGANYLPGNSAGTTTADGEYT